MSQSELIEQHSFTKSLIFKLKSSVLIGLRGLKNIQDNPTKFQFDSKLIDQPVIAFSDSELWNPNDTKENWILTAGKIQNLRIASQKINGLEIKANETFSFWKHIGNPNYGQGYVVGREIKEGCIVPTIAGGLCQLSNALYDAALNANFEIIERHKHTKIIQGSLAEKDRDATVKWNYIDLRFRSAYDFRIETELTSTHLIVRYKSQNKDLKLSENIDSKLAFNFLNDCYSCGNDSCHQHEDQSHKNQQIKTTAYILDEKWPEYDKYISKNINENDRFIFSMKKIFFIKTNRYNWSFSSHKDSKTTLLSGIYRALKLRFSKNKNPFELSLQLDEKIANSASKLIPIESTHLVISQNLLPFIYKKGMLGGRTFDVLMTRLPIETLHERLDYSHFIYPESKTLKDFRANKNLIDLENNALNKAQKIISPHTDIQKMFQHKIVKLDWNIEQNLNQKTGNKILFSASAVGRKGAYEMRKLAKELNLQLVILGRNLEMDNFWQNIQIEKFSENYDEIGLIIYPTIIENQPRQPIKAVSYGIPIITTTACGLQDSENVKVVKLNDYNSLKKEVENYLSIGKFSSAPHSDQEPS
ncbi:VanW family protein [Empedobacter falsenii]|uniref:VanW family protein n=1 Tax=Empedobacter falsenii TaxID=343874 RepID=UPI002577E930|nr:VanW family protein [Empedobacter falsenii]MDM1061577.1 VanW family protein [Empedobacter falsenii]